MRDFANSAPERTGLLVPGYHNPISGLTPLMGMFDLNDSIVNDGGRANFYYASEQYRQFMCFLSELKRESLLSVSLNYQEFFSEEVSMGRTGWSSISSAYVAQSVIWRMHSNVLIRDPNAKLLITPPEIGASGDRGTAISSRLSFTPDVLWVIGAQVSDLKLSKILEIFDEVSFDHQTLVMVRFGFEGEDFEWEGEPYNSRIIQSSLDYPALAQKGVQVFNTYIYDERTTIVYYFGSSELAEFLLSDEALSMLIPPYREDITGEFYERLNELNSLYEAEHARIRQEFYRAVIDGEADVDFLWDSYISELYANGLREYQLLFELFPSQ